MARITSYNVCYTKLLRLILALCLFALGLYGLISRQGFISMLISVELILNAAGLNFVAFNTFLPHVGGVARSISGFTAEFRKRGHRVVVVAPIFEGIPERETDVVRIPAVQNFSGSDFSVPVPTTGKVIAALKRFTPQIVHAHLV